MNRAPLFSFATSLAAAAVLACGFFAPPVFAQDDGEARLTSRTIAPPLSVRAMPAAPPVHKLSIGPLATPVESGAMAAPEGRIADTALGGVTERANLGDAESNYRLGLRYLAGEGVARDFVEAFARIRLAAEGGHPRAVCTGMRL